MEVTETVADGLKHEFHIVVPAGELEGKVTSRLDELGRTIQLPGFRPGKVPMQILRRRYGPSVLGEVVESTVQGSSADTIRERNLRPALPPKVDIVSFSEGADLEYNMMVEVLPDIPAPDFGGLDVERLVVEVPEESVDAAIGRIAEQQRKTEAVARPAENDDILVVDVEATAGGEEIAGAAGKDRQIQLGTGGFIPGFEEQLVGATAAEHREVRVTFPDDYAAAHLAGKEAVFQVDVKEVRQRLPAVIDDELAVAVGLENLAELRQEVRQQMERDYAAASRLRLKRALLDKLAERYDFPVPAGMVEMEFDNIWAQHQADQERQRELADEGGASVSAAAADDAVGPVTADQALAATEAPSAAEAPSAIAVPAPATGEERATGEEPSGSEGQVATGEGQVTGEEPSGGDSEEAERAEYRKIAERRVRLGLLLAEVGNSNNITVTQDELNQAITREVRRHPGYERQALDFYRQNPEAVASLRAPIFEDKVIDFIVEMAKLPERRVSPKELLALPEPDDENAVTGSETAGPAAEPSA
ncbi:MAG TPA: trigger factor [Stellaceae bacterium]|nr:trigger factor [Stellaceae bacterium]